MMLGVDLKPPGILPSLWIQPDPDLTLPPIAKNSERNHAGTSRRKPFKTGGSRKHVICITTKHACQFI